MQEASLYYCKDILFNSNGGYDKNSSTYEEFLDCTTDTIHTAQHDYTKKTNDEIHLEIKEHETVINVIKSKYADFRAGILNQKEWVVACDELIEKYPKYRLILRRSSWFEI